METLRLAQPSRGTMSKPMGDPVRTKDVSLPKFSGNPQSNATFVSTTHFLPLLLWYSNAKRITQAAGLSESQSIRCMANHLTGAAQRLFFEQSDGQLRDLSLSEFGSQLMTMIPGHESHSTREALTMSFNKHTLFESLRRFTLLWQFSHLDSSNGVFVHATIRDKWRDKLNAAAPQLLTGAWHHCRLNAILEHKGARVGLITTKGFRDVLELRTLRMPRLYDMSWEKPPPLVERYLRRVVDERVDAHGAVERPLDETDAKAQVDALLAEKVDTIAVCLLNSFANPAHELAIKAIIAGKAPNLPVSISYEVLPEIKEYERTSTTVINAYVMPIVATYLKALRKGLDAASIPARLLLMQSNGGLTTDQAAAERPMNIIESGPAGGVVGAEKLARAKGFDKIITFDMGGTTAKASMVEAGQVMRAQEQSVGAGIMASSRLLTGAGYTLKVPAIDLAEIGAGGDPTCASTPAARCRLVPTAPARCPVPSATLRAEQYQPSLTPASSSDM
ncbi:MAG: hydantoinase/oxoprolinase family protein [Rhodospirillales bacterium]|nr:hydantoinase/oxoprolinase family protein [Rhodospirillales bacterium]